MPSLSLSTKQELGWHLHCLDRAERLVSQWSSGSTFYFNTESFFTFYLQKCFNSQRSSLIFPDSRLFQEWSFQSIFWTCHGKTGHYPREELAGEDCVFQCFSIAVLLWLYISTYKHRWPKLKSQEKANY